MLAAALQRAKFQNSSYLKKHAYILTGIKKNFKKKG